MSIKKYGIYLAFPPLADLRLEGLGRHLAAFLKAASLRKDLRFIIVCPSWSKKNLIELCQSEHVPQDGFEIITPASHNLLLRLFELKPLTKHNFNAHRLFNGLKSYAINIFNKIVGKHILLDIMMSPLFILMIFINFLLIATRFFKSLVIRFYSLVKAVLSVRSLRFSRLFVKIEKLLELKNKRFTFKLFLRENKIVNKLFSEFYRKETDRMLKIINRSEIKAWYSPNASWSEFNKIKAAKLMCVPDIKEAEFPIGFAIESKIRNLLTFKAVEKAVSEGNKFVTYSQHIKFNSLMKKFDIKDDNIYVIPHAANNLANFISIQEINDADSATLIYAQEVLSLAIRKAYNADYAFYLCNILTKDRESSLKFFFYPSQFRPSKNILTLLRAFKFLLRHKYINYKLILTGKPKAHDEIDNFINEHHLTKDVLLLNGLSVVELAACYKLADIAINPSLSEGACPFTFTEALSVNTPTLMARIPVTTEIITDESLQDMMLFDPYNWEDLAEKMEWLLENRECCLNAQLKFYNKIKNRSWEQVVDDYVAILDDLSSAH